MEAAASDNLSDVDDAVAAAQELEALVAIYGGKSLLEDERADVGYWSTTAAIGAGACGDGTGVGGDGGVGGSACGADDYGSVCLEVVSPRNWRFRLGGGATLEVFIPRGYPSRESPTPLLHCDWLDSRGRAEMVGRLLAMYCGAEVVFEWVEMLRTELGEAVDAREAPLAPAEDGSRIGACGGAPSGCRMCLERGRESGGLPDDASSTVATAFGQASLLGGRDAHGGDGVGAGADAAGDGGSGFYFEPSTSGFGQRARRFGPEAMSQAHAVQIVHGEPFTPPGKSVRSRDAIETGLGCFFRLGPLRDPSACRPACEGGVKTVLMGTMRHCFKCGHPVSGGQAREHAETNL